MNIALILSGGTGNRLGADIPKQYIKIGERTVISYCLEVLENCQSISAIQIVADERWHELISESALTKLKGFSRPGKTRQLSILNGLEDICSYADEEDLVIIHDAARPLISEYLIESVIEAAKAHDGAIPVLPMKDTVYLSEDGRRISALLDRKCVVAGQAPESFRLKPYYEANKKLLPDQIMKINGSTEPAILAGLDIVTIQGDEQNFKITTKDDLVRFKEIISRK
ncbi:MAG: IspD/TarI family cytidylyltransferase [Clostridiales bacterium]|nr:IspD/TarI family cytidylyltransferase [Clostridiales bacterium]